MSSARNQKFLERHATWLAITSASQKFAQGTWYGRTQTTYPSRAIVTTTRQLVWRYRVSTSSGSGVDCSVPRKTPISSRCRSNALMQNSDAESFL